MHWRTHQKFVWLVTIGSWSYQRPARRRDVPTKELLIVDTKVIAHFLLLGSVFLSETGLFREGVVIDFVLELSPHEVCIYQLTKLSNSSSGVSLLVSICEC